MQVIKKKQVWFIVVFGILTLVTMCFLKNAQNNPKKYPNGKVVEVEVKDGHCIFKAATGDRGSQS